jgi:cysteine synthase A
MPRGTSAEKIRSIEFYGGRCHLVDDPATIYEESRRLAQELNGHYMDQFTYAERATDWRGNNNIADTIFKQMELEPNPVPEWIVCGAGTGGTSATFGRYVRYQKLSTQICVVDPENSVFYDSYYSGNATAVARWLRRGRHWSATCGTIVHPTVIDKSSVFPMWPATPPSTSWKK